MLAKTPVRGTAVDKIMRFHFEKPAPYPLTLKVWVPSLGIISPWLVIEEGNGSLGCQTSISHQCPWVPGRYHRNNGQPALQTTAAMTMMKVLHRWFYPMVSKSKIRINCNGYVNVTSRLSSPGLKLFLS